MKKALWIILAVISVAACKKNKLAPPANVVGKWELHRRYGGNINPPDTTFQAGNGTILQFNADSTYKSYYRGILVSSGTFRISRNAYAMNGEIYDELYYTSVSDYPVMVPDIAWTSGNILTLKPLLPDAATMQYNKLSN